jgi:hypothetical protein
MKILLYALLFCFTLPAPAQEAPLAKKNSVYICFQPNDLGYGLRFDRSFRKIELYISATKGTYLMPKTKHLKFSIGTTFYKKQGKMDHGYNFLSAGLTYNQYKELQTSINPYKRSLRPFAFEVGAGTVIQWFTLAVRYELIKNNSSVEIGFRF